MSTMEYYKELGLALDMRDSPLGTLWPYPLANRALPRNEDTRVWIKPNLTAAAPGFTGVVFPAQASVWWRWI